MTIDCCNRGEEQKESAPAAHVSNKNDPYGMASAPAKVVSEDMFM
jgi:hypothetical protein